MNKVKIIMICILVACVSFGTGAYVSDTINKKAREKENRLQKEFEEYAASTKTQYTYPQEEDEEHQGISVAYTSRVLKKKANNEKLTNEENELILNFAIQENGKGVAYTKFMEHGDGMGKSTRRVFETSDGGEHWNVINEGQYSFGYYDITYMDDVLIESAFGTTAEKGYFNISQDGGHTFESIPCEEIFNGGNRVVYPEKTGEDRQKKTVTYRWIDLYTKEVITKAEYDLKMNFIRNVN